MIYFLSHPLIEVVHQFLGEITPLVEVIKRKHFPRPDIVRAINRILNFDLSIVEAAERKAF
jgi:hypothetical protein